ncbi:MAG: hypothetical protein R2852_09800 [Bacteroidia bacterium]
MNKIKICVLSIVILTVVSCQNKSQEIGLSKYSVNFNGVLDTILPHFAKLHDSIPESAKFAARYSEYMQVHKEERQYEWMNYSEQNDGYSYFLISRSEPSIRKDKFSAICGRFKRQDNGKIDSASYEELFWTWKMKKEELSKKANHLFKTVISQGNVNEFTPEHSDGEWVEFPGNGVVYDKAQQKWVASPNKLN